MVCCRPTPYVPLAVPPARPAAIRYQAREPLETGGYHFRVVAADAASAQLVTDALDRLGARKF